MEEQPRSPRHKPDRNIEDLLLRIFGGWMEIQGHMMKRAQKLIAFPIYLMLIRVVLETVFRNAASFLFVNPMVRKVGIGRPDLTSRAGRGERA
eukprot:762637-Hanusia_phi.AAC.3